MSIVTENIGNKIRAFRKQKQITIQELSKIIYKSKATISKYEHGSIAIDIDTLYEIAKALDVSVDQLLYQEDALPAKCSALTDVPLFFRNTNQLFFYYYDGRNKEVSISVIDILAQLSSNTFKIYMYMNCHSVDLYQICENRYTGELIHYDSISNMILTHQDNPVEILMINIMSPFINTPYKWSMGKGISSRPLMPSACKGIISKKPIPITKEFINSLMISKDDIRSLKQYNMFTVMG